MTSETMDWCPQPHNELSQQCMSGLRELEADELEVAMCELSLSMLDVYVYKPEPQKPLVLQRFESDKNTYDWTVKTLAEKQVITKRIMEKTEVIDYNEGLRKTVFVNYSNVKWLEKMMRVFLEWDEPARAECCEEFYNTYPEVMRYGQEMIWKKKVFPRR